MNLSPPTAQTDKFAVAFTSAARRGLERVIGKNEAESVLFHMRMDNGLLDPAEFDRRLVELLGKPATVCLEREIVPDLAERLNLPLAVLDSNGGFDFNALVRAAEKAASAERQSSP